MSHTLRIGAAAVFAAVAFWSCKDSTPTTPPAPLALSAASRHATARDDSGGMTVDSVTVTLSGSTTASWVVTHGAAPWLSLTTTEGSGNGVVRWQRDAGVLLAGTYVDTITVTQQGGGATAKLIDTLLVRSIPAQYISVARAWRPGERDSAAAFVLRHRSWGEYSDLAPLVFPTFDSTSEIVPNPAWPGASGQGASVAHAPQWASGWSSLGMDVRIVYDSMVDVPGVQLDSLDWIFTFWWNPADSLWRGYVVRAIKTSIFAYASLNTTAFDGVRGDTGTAGGEAKRSSPIMYWESNSGQYRISGNTTTSGTWLTIASGPYTGGNYRTGKLQGRLSSVVMACGVGFTCAPTSQTIDWNYGNAPGTPAQAIMCYYTPVPVPTGLTQCVGSGFARLVALARSGRTSEIFTGVAPGRAAVRSARSR